MGKLGLPLTAAPIHRLSKKKALMRHKSGCGLSRNADSVLNAKLDLVGD
jgi:hypothetical protein